MYHRLFDGKHDDYDVDVTTYADDGEDLGDPAAVDGEDLGDDAADDGEDLGVGNSGVTFRMWGWAFSVEIVLPVLGARRES